MASPTRVAGELHPFSLFFELDLYRYAIQYCLLSSPNATACWLSTRPYLPLDVLDMFDIRMSYAWPCLCPGPCHNPSYVYVLPCR